MDYVYESNMQKKYINR